ncbi:MAG TPA: PilT/PilU family type 4a pilus ATPase [Candidatus Woesebacteria bacterium]|jgi:twitching motility protein PilT|nr:PilT/PilU family type 4a pilus ATPase [Candidatus Woesebacteria bacterium]HNS94436.1 PilT/PilU family type 4a pilus ATPase [Candidatus Woesebacteria bacterium]
MNIHELLQTTIERKASDLHLVVGYPPALRINREMYHLNNMAELTKNQIEELVLPLMSDLQRKRFMEDMELDFSSVSGTERFRVNCYYQKGTIAASFRHVSSKIRTIEELTLPQIFHQFIRHPYGLVLFTGPTGEGKSTSLAALIQELNETSTKHIVTIEDPIEYVFPKRKGIISQRELALDTHSWTNALRAVLRQDPDIILVGEMRDYETIAAALTAAETGHLVFSTLHTSSTVEAINRIVDVFPPHQQSQVRSQLAAMLRVVVAQRLVPSISTTNPIVPVVEILQNTSAVAALVREGKFFMLDSVLETGDDHGMIIMEKYLSKLIRENVITRDVGMQNALRPQLLMKYL